ncbi:MAG: Polymorphic membrane protein [Parcubacteria group bacterium LiPW_15]|nr:MAG: Polymorphic membrane protein [Parcubacteria group bacterium LiPW_15]
MKNIFPKLILAATSILIVGFIIKTLPSPNTAEAVGTNISSSAGKYWAWNDVVGWINFYDTQSIIVGPYGLTGYASSSFGEVSLDCNTTPIGNICGTSNYQVLNDGNGNLSGWGWNDQAGWISFCGGQNTSACPGTVGYEVLVSAGTGIFTGWAWNDLVGWISFNCSNVPGSCTTSQYDVETTWVATSTSGFLESTTYDTGIAGGAQINSVLWKGSQPAGTSVGFQFAGSNSSSGPWIYTGPSGTNSYYTVGPSISLPVDYALHNNQRYFRYKVQLVSDQAQRNTPRVDDVIVNWSP